MSVPLFRPFVAPQAALMPALHDVLYGPAAYLSQGERVRQFEAACGEFLDAPHVVAVSSCTAALHLALLVAGVKPGREVVTTPLTAEPTNLAIRHAGGRVVWADVDAHTGNIDPLSVAACITPQTQAIMVVHYGGVPADIESLLRVSDDSGVPLIFDAAHALGAKYDGCSLAQFGDFVTYSFQAIKHLTTADGGLLVCRDRHDAALARELRWFGIDRQAPRETMNVKRVGYKYNMHDLTAAIGLVQLAHIRPVLDTYIENGRWFDQHLRRIPGLTLLQYPPVTRPSYWFYTVLAERRDDLSRKLRGAEIACGTVHRRNDWHTVFSDSKRDLPQLDWFYERMLHIPCGWWVTPHLREYIRGVIADGW